ncbi:hypothetical protein ACFE04_028336 [Oxalis oulophora]
MSKQYLANVAVASQDWPEVTKYAGLVSAQAHRQELIHDLYKTWQDPERGTMHGGMVKGVGEVMILAQAAGFRHVICEFDTLIVIEEIVEKLMLFRLEFILAMAEIMSLATESGSTKVLVQVYSLHF